MRKDNEAEDNETEDNETEDNDTKDNDTKDNKTSEPRSVKEQNVNICINVTSNISEKKTEKIEFHVSKILELIGRSTPEAMQNTPKRVAKSYSELFAGYDVDLGDVLGKQFQETSINNDIILVRNIRYYSICEHHMLPVVGTADVAYVPEGSVVGLSKISRLVEIFARRMQLQERMTSQISHSIQEYLKPKGSAVRLKARHYCMLMRGACDHDSEVLTFHYEGILREEAEKARFLSMLNR